MDTVNKQIIEAGRRILSTNVVDLHRETGIRMVDIKAAIRQMEAGAEPAWTSLKTLVRKMLYPA